MAPFIPRVSNFLNAQPVVQDAGVPGIKTPDAGTRALGLTLVPAQQRLATSVNLHAVSLLLRFISVLILLFCMAWDINYTIC